MLHVRTHRLELARHRIECDLKRLAIEHSREPPQWYFQTKLRAEGDRAARAHGPQTTINDISRGETR
jgi:hypothetical protein